MQVIADVHCDWEGLSPTYRLYVNDELFTERTWTWTDNYLEEMLQIEAEPGDYRLRWELVPPHLAKIHVKNLRVEHGKAQIVEQNILRIKNESQ